MSKKVLVISLALLVFFNIIGCNESASADSGPVDTKVALKADTVAVPVTPQVTEENVTRQIASPSISEVTSDTKKTVVPDKVATLPTNVAKKGPSIVFESTTYNFGTINPDTVNIALFDFKNAGDAVLSISQIKSTCGCSVPTLAKKTYQPGEKGQITVTYRPGKTKGGQSKRLHVFSNDPKKPDVPIDIRANVDNMVAASPESLTLSLKKPNAGCPQISVKSKDGHAFSITKISSNPDCIKFDYDPNETSTEFVLKPQVNMLKLEKALKGFITIDVNHPDSKSLKVNFTAPPIYSVRPGTLYFFAAEPGKPLIREKVWVINNYKDKFKVVSVKSEKGSVKVLETVSSGNDRYKLKLQVTPPPKSKDSNKFQDDFIIKTDTGSEIKVKCSVFYKVPKRTL